jgi:hypothetical protein
VDSGVAALLGVFVGGFVTAGVEMFLRGREARRAKRIALRVTHSALVATRAEAMTVVETRGELADHDPKTVRHEVELQSVWREHRAALVSLSWEDWWDVERAVVRAATFPWLEDPPEEGTWEGPIEMSYELLVVELNKAVDVVDKHASRA